MECSHADIACWIVAATVSLSNTTEDSNTTEEELNGGRK